MSVKRTTKTSYALRDPATNMYWGGWIKGDYRHGPLFFKDSTPRWHGKFGALESWKLYERERLIVENIPSLVLVEFRTKIVETEKEIGVSGRSPKVDFKELVLRRIRIFLASDSVLEWAFSRFYNDVIEVPTIKKYRYVLHRKRGNIGVTNNMISEQLPYSRSYGHCTFVKTETELVFAKVLLGDALIEHFDMTKFYASR
jgi:hypothetical protein